MTDDKNKECPLLRDTAFVDLMKRRIFNVLLIANPYDAFMLEDDGRVEEKIFDEYVKLGLRYPPRFFQVASQEEAEEELGKTSFDLIICMPGTDNNDVFDIARGIKTDNPTVPIVVLTPFSHGIRKSMQNMDFSIFDYVFCWLGNTDLLLSIIKLIEDKMNLENDVAAGVQMILLVEDSIRFYSSILPQPLSVRTPAKSGVLHRGIERPARDLADEGARRKSCWPVRMKRPGTCTPVIRRTRWGSSATAVSRDGKTRTRWPGTSYCRPSVPKTSSCR